MTKNLYVGNLAFQTTSDDLTTAFAEYGTVTRVHIITDRETGQSRGFGFVEMSEGADQAIAGLHGTSFQGRSLTVNQAKPREERPRAASSGSPDTRNGNGYGRRDSY